jgi:prepilin-type N-terminal cleavage/methylation domain-containing protein
MKTSRFPSRAARLGTAVPLAGKGFTLLELMVSLTLSLLLTAAVLPTLVSGLVLGMKTVVSNRNGNNIRLSVEDMASRISSAVRAPRLDPVTATSSSRVVYTTAVGLPGQADAATLRISDTLKVAVNGTCHPAAGDRVQIAGLDLGEGLQVISVADPRTATGKPSLRDNATVTLKFSTSIKDGTTGTASDIIASQAVSVFRDSAYAVTTASDGKNQLVWFEQASSSTPTAIVAHDLAAGAAQPFRMVNNRLAFSFLSNDDTGIRAMASGNSRAYTHAALQGEIGSKAGSRFDVIAMAATTLPSSKDSSAPQDNIPIKKPVKKPVKEPAKNEPTKAPPGGSSEKITDLGADF